MDDYIQLPMMKIPNFLRKKLVLVLVFFNQLKPENKNQNIAVIIKKLSKSDTYSLDKTGGGNDTFSPCIQENVTLIQITL